MNQKDLIEKIEQRTKLAGHNRIGLLLFRLSGKELFGINVFKIQEVLLHPPVFHIPGLPKAFEGASDIRGRTVPILDLQKHLKRPDDEVSSPSGYLIVTEFNQSIQGFLVREVVKIINVSVSDIVPPPDWASSGFLTATTRYQGELVQILDVESILAETTNKQFVVGNLEKSKVDLVEEIKRRQLKILVVDDSRSARTQIKQVLDLLGLNTTMFFDGKEAFEHLETLKSQGIDVGSYYSMMISDIEMPSLDGYTLTSMIKKDEKMKNLHVILHTSLSGVFNLAMVEKVEANNFVPKYSPESLTKAVLDRVKEIIQF